jgi:formylglycine-generating enzyme required for sulfatase activity
VGPNLEWVSLPGGIFLMGADDAWAYAADLEGPVRPVTVAAFDITVTPVTVAQFADFVGATGFRTDAEVFGDSLVFVGDLGPTAHRWPTVAATPWWHVVEGATWRYPSGPDVDVDATRDRAAHPVTHVSRRDAEAFCAWSDTALPTEAQWEYAARGGLEQQPFPWGPDLEPGGTHRMNVWQGDFPQSNTAADGHAGTAPVRSYAPNAFGVHEMTGNVWEWTAGGFDDARGDTRAVTRGGSYLCHASYCRRYRVSARSGSTSDTSSGHTGFRVVTTSETCGAPDDPVGRGHFPSR